MRVLVVTAMYPTPEDPVRGIAVQREVRRLRTEGIAVTVIGKEPGWRAYWAQLKATRAALRHGHDVVHAHYGTSALTAAAASVSNIMFRIPLIVTLHGSDVATGPTFRLSKYWLQYWLSVMGCGWAGRVIVQDESMLVDLPTWLRRRSVVLGQAVKLQDLPAPAFRHARRVLFLSDSRRPVKRFSLAEAAVSHSLLANVILDSLDLHAPPEIPAAMASATVGLLTSEREGMPIAVKEALACGLPVVAVDLPPLRKLSAIFPDMVTLTPADPQALAAAVDAALRADPPDDHVRAETIHRLRLLRWTEPERTRSLLQIYEQAHGPQRPGGRRH